MRHESACKIIVEHYGKDNISQIWKPDGKKYWIVSFSDGEAMSITGREIEALDHQNRINHK